LQAASRNTVEAKATRSWLVRFMGAGRAPGAPAD
jgi:hypothetical protein